MKKVLGAGWEESTHINILVFGDERVAALELQSQMSAAALAPNMET